MGKKSNDELLKELIEVFKPKLQAMIEEILAEKLRADPHALDGAGPVKDRRSFLRRMVSK